MYPMLLPITMAVQRLEPLFHYVSAKVSLAMKAYVIKHYTFANTFAAGVPGPPMSLNLSSTGDCQNPLGNSVISASWNPPEGMFLRQSNYTHARHTHIHLTYANRYISTVTRYVCDKFVYVTDSSEAVSYSLTLTVLPSEKECKNDSYVNLQYNTVSARLISYAQSSYMVIHVDSSIFDIS